MSPVDHLPVSSLVNRIVVTRVKVANGESVLAMLRNVHLDSPRATREFITISAERNGKWFYLARYFDAELDEFGPEDLAHFLGLSVDEVFPIYYDVSDVAEGADEIVRGVVHAEPAERLSRRERLSLVLRDRP